MAFKFHYHEVLDTIGNLSIHLITWLIDYQNASTRSEIPRRVIYSNGWHGVMAAGPKFIIFNWLIDGLVDWLIYWLMEWLVDWLIDWLIDWLFD